MSDVQPTDSTASNIAVNTAVVAGLLDPAKAITSSGSQGDVAVTIETLGQDILSRIEAGDRAKDRSDDMYKSAGLQLIEARKRVSDFGAFLRDHCNGLSRSRAYELIAIAEGRTTTEKTSADWRTRARQSRANKPHVSVTSRTRGVSTARPQPPKSLAQKALAEFKVAVDTWFAKMDDEAKQAAIAYVHNKISETLS